MFYLFYWRAAATTAAKKQGNTEKLKFQNSVRIKTRKIRRIENKLKIKNTKKVKHLRKNKKKPKEKIKHK